MITIVLGGALGTVAGTLSAAAAAAVAENASRIGRRWLSVVPFNWRLRLQRADVAAGLDHRPLRFRAGPCPSCGLDASL